MPFTYPYPRPAVTCDVVVFSMRADDLAVLLVERRQDPFKGRWALPGGYVNENEALERAASRELYEETDVSSTRLVQLGAFGDPGRDPRGHTITVAYVTFLVAETTITAGDDAVSAEWHAFRSLALEKKLSSRPKPKRVKRSRSRANGSIHLAFDHARIVAEAYRRLCRHLEDPLRDTAFDLVPPRFTLAELQRIYEVVLGQTYSPRVFRNHFIDKKLVVPATTRPRPPSKAAAQLYRWNR